MHWALGIGQGRIVPTFHAADGGPHQVGAVFSTGVYNTLTMDSDFTRQIQAELGDLDSNAQQRVLDYVRSLKRTRAGMPAGTLKKHIGCLGSEDGQEMLAAIDSGCEQVNLDEW